MPLKLDIVTVEREIFTADDVDMVILPGAEGVMGILPRHEALVSTLKAGEVEIKRAGEREILAIGGGFVEVGGDRVIVMADVAERSDEIDLERAERARQNAVEALARAPEKADRMEAAAALRRAEIRLRVGRQRRTGGRDRAS